MAEPKVGMKFGTYNTLTQTLRNQGKKLEPSILEGVYGKNWKQQSYYQTLPNNNSNYATTLTDTSNSKHVRATVMLNRNPFANKREDLWYAGATNNYNGDVKMTRIIGNDTYAIDINGNGVVDKGKIFKCKENCAISVEDEGQQHLNLQY